MASVLNNERNFAKMRADKNRSIDETPAIDGPSAIDSKRSAFDGDARSIEKRKQDSDEKSVGRSERIRRSNTQTLGRIRLEEGGKEPHRAQLLVTEAI